MEREVLIFKASFVRLSDAFDDGHRRTFDLRGQQYRRGLNKRHNDLVRSCFGKSRISESVMFVDHS